MIFSLSIIHNHDRVSSIARVIHTTTWDYFTSNLPDHFRRSPKVVKEAIITGINDLMQEFWSISSDEAVGAVEASFFAMRRLFEILQNLFATVVVCSDDFGMTSTLLIKFYRCWNVTPATGRCTVAIPTSGSSMTTEAQPNLWYCVIGIERCLNSQFLNPKIWVK